MFVTISVSSKSVFVTTLIQILPTPKKQKTDFFDPVDKVLFNLVSKAAEIR